MSSHANDSALPSTCRVAAFDIGSNALRLGIGEVEPNFQVSEIDFTRKPLSLGKVVFESGEAERSARPIPQPMIDQVVQFFVDGLVKLKHFNISPDGLIAVATSAVREAPNRSDLINAILTRTGIELELLSGEHEARIGAQGVPFCMTALRRGEATALVIEVGGGSLQASLIRDGTISVIGSYPHGARQLFSRWDGEVLESEAFERFVHAELSDVRQDIIEALAGRPVDIVVGLGGVAAEIRHRVGSSDRVCSVAELARVLTEFRSTNEKERERILLRADRALAVIPSTIIYLSLTEAVKAERFGLFDTGIREGLYLEVRLRQLARVQTGKQDGQRPCA